MSGKWADSDRRTELPPDWASIVKRIKVRDGGRCRWILPSKKRCPRKGTDVDHRYAPDRHADKDLWLLCEHHHKKKTAREAAEGRRKRRQIVSRAETGSPGRLR